MVIFGEADDGEVFVLAVEGIGVDGRVGAVQGVDVRVSKCFVDGNGIVLFASCQ